MGVALNREGFGLNLPCKGLQTQMVLLNYSMSITCIVIQILSGMGGMLSQGKI